MFFYDSTFLLVIPALLLALYAQALLDGKLLVDGGLANNVPVSVARAMGADVVIAHEPRRCDKAHVPLGKDDGAAAEFARGHDAFLPWLRGRRPRRPRGVRDRELQPLGLGQPSCQRGLSSPRR